jgi:hypothetical protein
MGKPLEKPTMIGGLSTIQNISGAANRCAQVFWQGIRKTTHEVG